MSRKVVIDGKIFEETDEIKVSFGGGIFEEAIQTIEFNVSSNELSGITFDSTTSIIKHAIRTTTEWTTNQTAMEALYGVGGYYTLLSLWEDDIPSNLVSINQQWVGECYNDWSGGLSDFLNIAARTVSATQNIIIKAAEENKHNGIERSGFSVNSNNNFDGIKIYPDYTEINHIEIHVGGANNSTGINNASGYYVKIFNNIIVRNVTASNSGSRGYPSVINGRYCTFIGNRVTGFDHGLAFYERGIIENNVFHDCSTSGMYIDDNYTTSKIYNNICFNNGVQDIQDISSPAAMDDNATSDATGEIINITSAEFVNSAGGDFRLASNSQLRGIGLYNPIVNGDIASPFFDIDGSEWPATGAWDIGADSAVTIIAHGIRTTTDWTANQTAMEALYGVGGYYTLLSLWEDDIPADLVAADEQWIAECYNDWPSGLVDNLDESTKTTDVTRNIIVTSPVGERHDGTPNSGFKISVTGSVAAIIVRSGYTEVSYLDISAGSKGISGVDLLTYGKIHGNLIYSTANAISSVTTGTMISCNIITGTSTSTGILPKAWYINNARSNVVYGCGVGIGSASGSSFRMSNNVCYNNTTNYDTSASPAGNSYNNAASDATTNTPPGNNPLLVDIVSADFIDAANENYHLSETSQLRDQGVNLYSEFQFDIDGNEWPDTGAWDIGADSAAVIVEHALRTVTGWTANQTAMEARYGVGNYYTTLALWEDGEDRDLVAVNEADYIVMYNDWSSGYPLEYVAIAGLWTTSKYNNIVITVAEGERHNGIIGDHSGAWILIDNATGSIKTFLDYLEASWLDILATANATGSGKTIYTAASEIFTISNCITESNAIKSIVYNASAYFITQNETVNNCIGKCSISGAAAFYNVHSSTQGSVKNCLAVDSDLGYRGYEHPSEDHHIYMYNCIAYNCTTDDNGYGVGATCATSKASGDTQYTVFDLDSSDFLDVANGDYHLSNTSQLIDEGTNYYSNFQYDIDGQEWPSSGVWDIGPDKYTLSFTVAVDELIGLDFQIPVSSQIIEFSVSSNELSGVNFLSSNISESNISINELSGIDFSTQNSIPFAESVNQLSGINFFISGEEVVSFDFDTNELAGLDFFLQESIIFNPSSNELQGVQFLIGSEQTVSFNVSDNILTGIDFWQYQTSSFNVSSDELIGLNFSIAEIVTFVEDENNLVGLSFLIAGEQKVTFDPSINSLEGINFSSTESYQFSLDENLLTGISFAVDGQQTVAFDVSTNSLVGINFGSIESYEFLFDENLLTGISFQSSNTLSHSISDTQLTGLTFEPINGYEFSISENSLNGVSFEQRSSLVHSIANNELIGISFIAGQEDFITFNISDNQLSGIQNNIIELSEFSVSQTELLGEVFTQHETSPFTISDNQLIGPVFSLSDIVSFSESETLLEGELFTLLETNYVFFNVSEDILTGLEFVPYQAFIGLPRDAITFEAIIKRKEKQETLISRQIRKKVEF